VTKICPKCSSENLDAAGFCQNCGEDINNVVTSTNQTKKSSSGTSDFWNKQSKGGKVAISLGVCCLGIIIIIAIVGMFSPDTTTTTTNVSTASSAQTTQGIANKTYTGQGLTFNYPSTWTIDDTGNINTPNEGMGSISNIGSLKEYASEPPVIPATLEAAAANIRSGVMGPYDTKDMTIGGVPGIEYIPTDYNSDGMERVDVVFVKDDTLYDIFLTTKNYDNDKEGFDMIINTMKIQ